jgi:hypothetical protein
MTRARDLSRLGNAEFGVNGKNLGIGTTAATSALTVRGDSFVTGVVTAGSFVGDGSGLTGLPIAGSQNLNATLLIGNNSAKGFAVGISTFNNAVVVGGGITDLVVNGNARVTGVLTSGTISATTVTATSSFVGNLTGTATTAQNLTGTPNITVGVTTVTTLSSSGIATYIGITTSLVPTTASKVSLGTSAFPFKDIVISAGTLTIADANPLTDGVAISNTAQYLQLSRGGFKILSSGVPIFQVDPFTGLVESSTSTIISNTYNTSGIGSGAFQLAGGGYVGKDFRVDGTIFGHGANFTGVITATSFYGYLYGNSSTSNYATSAGIATYSASAGVATYASSSGVSTYAPTSGITTYSYIAGFSTVSGVAGFSTYTTTAGISTLAQGLTGTPNITVGIVTATSEKITGSASSTSSALFLNGTPSRPISNYGLLGIGTTGLGFSDTNIVAHFHDNVNSYSQFIFQNESSGNNASTDIVVNSDKDTGTQFYGDFGVNSTTFIGGGPFDDPNGVYLYSAGGTLSVGTQDDYDFRIITGAATSTPVTRVTVRAVSGYIGVGTEIPTSILNIKAGDGTPGTAPLKFTHSSSLLAYPEEGSIEYDNYSFYGSTKDYSRGVIPTEQFVCLTGIHTLASQTGVQPIFDGDGGPIGGSLTLDVGTYQFECGFSLSSMSSVNTSFGFALGGGATKTQSWTSFAFKPSSFTTPTNASITWNNAANTALTPNSTNTNAHAFIKGTIRVTVKGTVIPQVSLGSAAAAVVQTNSYFKIYSVGSATTAFSGYWL